MPTLFHPGHAPAGEVEPFVGILPAVVSSFMVTATDVTITTLPYGGPPVGGGQTQTAYFVSTLPPTYGVAGMLDTTPPSPWGSLAPGGDLVPIPISEPGILFPAGVALTALGLVASRRSRQK